MLDPEGKLISILQNINRGMSPDNYDGTGVDGNLEGNIVNPMEGGVMEDYAGAKFGAPRGDRTHKGRDIVGPAGMKVVSALPGTVTGIIEVGKLPGGGFSKGIYVKHSNGMETRYLHVYPSVKIGDQVKAGQQIGKITEKDAISSVAHLHFEVIVNGVHVNPEPIVRGSLKLSDIASGKVPGLSVKGPKNPNEIETYDGTKTSPATAESMKQVKPTSSVSSKPQQVSHAINTSNVLIPGQNLKPLSEAKESNIAFEMSEQKLKPQVASSVMNVFSNSASQISAPSKQQKSMEIANLSRYDEESQNNTLLINNQSSPTLPAPTKFEDNIVIMKTNNSTEVIKNLMLQRLIS